MGMDCLSILMSSWSLINVPVLQKNWKGRNKFWWTSSIDGTSSSPALSIYWILHEMRRATERVNCVGERETIVESGCPPKLLGWVEWQLNLSEGGFWFYVHFKVIECPFDRHSFRMTLQFYINDQITFIHRTRAESNVCLGFMEIAMEYGGGGNC